MEPDSVFPLRIVRDHLLILLPPMRGSSELC